MKRYVLLLLAALMVIPLVANAVGIVVVKKKSVAACPAGTYDYAWDGDYTSDTDKMCSDSGGGTIDGTLNAATVSASYGVSGNGIQCNADDDYLEYTTVDLGTDWTVWMDIRVVTTSVNTALFEYYGSANDLVYFYSRSDGTLRMDISGNGVGPSRVTTTATITDNTWHRVGISLDYNGGSESNLAIKICTSTSDCSNAWLANGQTFSWGTEPTNFLLGNHYSAYTADEVNIDNVYIVNSYQAAHP